MPCYKVCYKHTGKTHTLEISTLSSHDPATFVVEGNWEKLENVANATKFIRRGLFYPDVVSGYVEPCVQGQKGKLNMEYVNEYDLATEQAIKSHAYAPAQMRRYKEAMKANKYAESNARMADGDVRLEGKWKYRDFEGYCKRSWRLDYGDEALIKSRSKHGKLKPSQAKALADAEYLEATTPAGEPITPEPYEFVDEEQPDDSVLMCIVGLLITLVVLLVTRR